MIYRILILCLFAVSAASAQDTVSKWVGQLASPDFKNRKKADQELTALPYGSLESLEKHLAHEDPEVRTRLEDIMRNIKERAYAEREDWKIKMAEAGISYRTFTLRSDGRYELSLKGVKKDSLKMLAGLPLYSLDGISPDIDDLSFLMDAPLEELRLRYSSVKDLTPLQGTDLKELVLRDAPVSDLLPLKGLPLTSLDLTGCRNVTDICHLNGLPLAELRLRGTGVTNLTPLEGMPLSLLSFTPAQVRAGVEVIRNNKTIKLLIPSRLSSFQERERFWSFYDLGFFSTLALDPADFGDPALIEALNPIPPPPEYRFDVSRSGLPARERIVVYRGLEQAQAELLYPPDGERGFTYRFVTEARLLSFVRKTLEAKPPPKPTVEKALERIRIRVEERLGTTAPPDE